MLIIVAILTDHDCYENIVYKMLKYISLLICLHKDVQYKYWLKMCNKETLFLNVFHSLLDF